jgi:hypothetical protein
MDRWLSALLVIGVLMVTGCSRGAVPSEKAANSATESTKSLTETKAGSDQADLSGIKTYLLNKARALRDHTAALQETADEYYGLAKAVNFDYAALWKSQRAKVSSLLLETKGQYLAANPTYESMEGIVAGVPSLADFDVDIDAGSPAEEDAESAVNFDLKLPDGTVLKQPGNYFYLAEAALWGTHEQWTVTNVSADINGDGKVEFGEVLPDANVLKGIADGFAAASADLLQAAQAWEPTTSDAFTALAVMTPTMSEYFEAWKESRFVSGDKATSKSFVAASRLQDISDIISSLEVIFTNVQPLIVKVDAVQAQQTGAAYEDLHRFITDLYAKEKAGRRFTPEEAEQLGAEAQNRATAIVGQIAQAAAKLKIEIKE